MPGNNPLGTAVINVIPNMDGSITEMRMQLRDIDLIPPGRKMGDRVSREQ